jgi:hypothetical protein
MKCKNLWWMALFAIAMAYFESAVVVYLRQFYNISDLMISKPWLDSQIGTIEIGREAASFVVLLAVGWIAGKKIQSRLGGGRACKVMIAEDGQLSRRRVVLCGLLHQY